MATDPPPKKEFSANVNQWTIYDKYMAHEEAKELAEENDVKNEEKQTVRRKFLSEEVENQRNEVNKKMIRCAKILERMVNQNNHEDIAIGNYCQ